MKKIAAVIATLLVVACSSTPKTDVSKETTSGNSNTTATTAPAPVANNSPATPVNASALASNTAESAQSSDKKQQPQNEMQKPQIESTYFDFDKSDVKPEFRTILEKQAALLKNRKMKVVLEGNADERGSAEYNMALGSRRANSVKQSLIIMGVLKSQIKVISYGNSRPRLTCHEENCWQENRRVDFVYPQS